MSNAKATLRRTGRIAVLTTAVSLTLAGGFASTASATSNNGPLNQPQSISKADANSGGANGQCLIDPKGVYCSTRDGSPSMNGNNGGKATGRPAAGEVGKADNKNPQGQKPNAKDDGNNGYECDGNNGIAKGNPAHTACVSKPPVVPVVPVVPPKVCVPPEVCVPPTTTVVPPTVVGVLGTSAVAPAAAVVAGEAAAANPLPAGAAAGEADTSGQLTFGGFVAFSAFLAFATRFMMRRRNGEV